MAIARDTYGTTSINPSTTQTVSLTLSGSATIILAFTVSDGASSPATGVTWNGDALTEIGSAVTNTGQEMGAWYKVNPDTGGPYDLIATWANNDYSMLCGISYTGTATSGQPDAYNSTSSNSATGLSVNVTTVADDSWIVGGGVQQSGGTLTGSGSFTRVASGTWNGFAVFDTNGAITPAGSTAVGYTSSNSPGGCLLFAVSIKEPAAGPANVKSVDGLAIASVKSVNGLITGSIKSINGLT